MKLTTRITSSAQSMVLSLSGAFCQFTCTPGKTCNALAWAIPQACLILRSGFASHNFSGTVEGSGPYFYLPESPVPRQEAAGGGRSLPLPRSTLSAARHHQSDTLLIETLPASMFEWMLKSFTLLRVTILLSLNWSFRVTSPAISTLKTIRIARLPDRPSDVALDSYSECLLTCYR